MAPARADRGSEIGHRSVLALQIVFALFVLLRLFMDIHGQPLGDETYYWLWGQNLAPSYFDHPPLHAWVLRLVATLAGWHPFSIRILTWITLAGTLWIFWLWSQRLAPADPRFQFWRTTTVYLASPLFFAMTLVSYNDHLLIFLCLASIHAFLRFAEKWEAAEPAPYPYLYLGAALLGLAVLTKYNGIFLGLGVALWVLVRPGLRPLLRNPHLYLAAALAIAMQAPVFYWNLSEGLASYNFHFSGRWSGTPHPPDFMAPFSFLLATALSLSPFLIWPLLKFLWGKGQSPFETRARSLAICVLALSTLGLSLISIYLGAFFYWNIVAYIAVIPLLVRHLGTRLQLWAHLIFGLLLAAAVVVNFAIMPIGPLLGRPDGGTAVNFGWEVVPGEVTAALEQHPDAFLAGTRYANAAQLGFALRRTDITALSIDQDQFDYWFEPSAYLGKNAVILADDNDGAPGLDYLRTHFQSLTLIKEIPIYRFDRRIFNFQIYLGETYRP